MQQRDQLFKLATKQMCNPLILVSESLATRGIAYVIHRKPRRVYFHIKNVSKFQYRQKKHKPITYVSKKNCVECYWKKVNMGSAYF